MEKDPKFIVEEVILKIKAMIETENYQIGDKFPSERQLSKDFGVSRNTVREAIRYFETLGAVETRNCSGTYFIQNENALNNVFIMKQLIEKYNINEMLDAREVIEVGIASLAAKNATRTDKQKLRKLYNDLELIQDANDKEHSIFAEIDYEFHKEIAVISRNSIMLDMIITIQDLLRTTIEVLGQSGQTQEIANRGHKRILEAIANNNSQEASKYMLQHITEQKQFMTRINNKGIETC